MSESNQLTVEDWIKNQPDYQQSIELQNNPTEKISNKEEKKISESEKNVNKNDKEEEDY